MNVIINILGIFSALSFHITDEMDFMYLTRLKNLIKKFLMTKNYFSKHVEACRTQSIRSSIFYIFLLLLQSKSEINMEKSY